MRGRERVETPRLILRKPRPVDAEAIFERYASDAAVTRFMGRPRHSSPDATRVFLEFSDAEWMRWLAGPYLVESREDGRLLGSTGLAFETPHRAATGYVFAKDAWGKGYATEAVRAVVEIARENRLIRLYALCHEEVTPTMASKRPNEATMEFHSPTPGPLGGSGVSWCAAAAFRRAGLVECARRSPTRVSRQLTG